MRSRSGTVTAILLLSLSITAPVIQAQESAEPRQQEQHSLQIIQLPEPDTTGGKPLMQALNDRKSTRQFSTKALPQQVLSNLLWAACGKNRPDGKRTAPSAKNWQEITVYVATKDGVYLYNASEHTLEPHMTGDIREATGIQPFTQVAPVNLIYVADFKKMDARLAEAMDTNMFYPAVDTGFISQNVYLFCASEGLATVVLGWVDKPVLEKQLNLNQFERVILTQPVGYPEE